MRNFNKILSDIIPQYYKELEINGWTIGGVVDAILFLTFINDALEYSEEVFTSKTKHIINLYLECLGTKSCYINNALVKD